MKDFHLELPRRAALLSVPLLATTLARISESQAASMLRLRCSANINLRTPVVKKESQALGATLTSSVSLGESFARSTVASSGFQRSASTSSGLGMSYPARATTSFWQSFRIVGNVFGYPLPTTFNYTAASQLEAFSEAGRPGSIALTSAYFSTNGGSSTVLLLSQGGITWPDRRGDANLAIRSQILAHLSFGASLKPILPDEVSWLADHAGLDLTVYETTFAPRDSWDALRLALLLAARELGIPSLRIPPGGLAAGASISVQLGATVSAQLSEVAPLNGPSGRIVTGLQTESRSGASGMGNGSIAMQVALKSVTLPRKFSPGTSLKGMFLELPSGSRVSFTRA